MYIEQLYTNCLAEAAYYIESNGEVAIIDPIREWQPYTELAARRGAKIKYIFETHFHADFISGHIDLAKHTGAEIVFGPNAHTNYLTTTANDNQEFRLGNICLKVLHTPGHTLESTSYLLLDETGNPHCVFTGDTLFVGDVGRPDLAVKSDLTMNDLAGMLFDSLQSKIKTLPDDVIVYPAHGAGSSCGKNIGKETFSTIGVQKRTNYALLIEDRTEFIKSVTDGLAAPPKYFFFDAKMNKEGYSTNTGKVDVTPINARDFKAFSSQKEYLVLDTRNPDDFEKGFVPEAINIGLNGQFAIWVGTLIEPTQKLLLVTDLGKEQETVTRLARVGFDNIAGCLDGGIAAWANAEFQTQTIKSIEATEFVSQKNATVLDVRKASEWENGVIENANLVELQHLESQLQIVPAGKLYVHCAGGYRSMIAASILKKNGFTDIVNVKGGFAKVKEAGMETVLPELAK